MSLLSIIKAVTGRLSLVQPAAVVASTDKQVIQLYNLANQAGLELARSHDWQILTKEFDFSTVTADDQVAALPSDFDHFMPNSFFNRTTRRPMTGPITSRQWQWIKAQPVYSTVYLAFRMRNGQYMVAPQPPAGQAVYYEYVSNQWAAAEGGAPQTSFLLDTDVSVLDETLIELSLTWRYLRAKGLDYAEEFTTYEIELEKAQARDGSSSMLSLSPQPIDLNRVNLPDGSFGV